MPDRETLQSKLSKLCDYYLEFISLDSHGVSAKQTKKKDEALYRHLTQLPSPIVSTDSDLNLLDQPDCISLADRARRGNCQLFIGYPTRLREGLVEPVFLYACSTESEPGTAPCVSAEIPLINSAVMRLGENDNNALQAAMRESEELGLDSESEAPDIVELTKRIASRHPEWDWKETPDPAALDSGGLQHNEGVFNRALLILAEPSTFTRGLERELKRLKSDANKLSNTALADYLDPENLRQVTQPDFELLEAVPLNSEQRQAIEKGLHNPICVVTGPPGTGKSQVVTSLLINAARQGMSVLFASRNHKAIEVVETRVNGLANWPFINRMGSRGGLQQEAFRGLADSLDKILAADFQDEEKNNYQACLQTYKDIRSVLKELDQDDNRLVKLRNDIDKLEQSVETVRRKLGKSILGKIGSINCSSCTKYLAALTKAVNRADYSQQGVLIEIFWRLLRETRYEEVWERSKPLLNLAGELSIKAPGYPVDDSDIQRWMEFCKSLSERCSHVEKIREYTRKLKEINNLSTLEETSAARFEKTNEMHDLSETILRGELRQRAASMSQQQRQQLGAFVALLRMRAEGERGAKDDYRRRFKDIMKFLPCWSVSTLSAQQLPFEARYFDLLIIDEASQCDIASALPLLYRAKKSVIIGDSQQLRHISPVNASQDYRLLKTHGLKDQYMNWAFSVNSIFDLASSVCGAGRKMMLRDHFRSHEDIINFSSGEFYDGQLRVATQYRKLKSPSGPAVRWMDCAGKTHNIKNKFQNSFVNYEEVQEVVGFVKQLFQEQYHGSIGVVSPYREHANEIRKKLENDPSLQQYLHDAQFLSETVHRFQGDERDLIIFSPIVSKGAPDWMLDRLRGESNLFNVAITRARAALIVIGDRNAALKSGITYLEKFANYTERLSVRTELPEEITQDMGPDYPVVAQPQLVSEWEKVFYRALYQADIRCHVQYEIDKYIQDFAIIYGDHRLNVEIDGEMYHQTWTGETLRSDQIRNRRMRELGWDVMRFWVFQVRDDLSGCVKKVKDWVDAHRDE